MQFSFLKTANITYESYISLEFGLSTSKNSTHSQKALYINNFTINFKRYIQNFDTSINLNALNTSSGLYVTLKQFEFINSLQYLTNTSGIDVFREDFLNNFKMDIEFEIENQFIILVFDLTFKLTFYCEFTEGGLTFDVLNEAISYFSTLITIYLVPLALSISKIKRGFEIGMGISIIVIIMQGSIQFSIVFMIQILISALTEDIEVREH
jgi:hypothetical protein